MLIRPIASGLHQNSTTFKLLVFHTVLLWLVTSWSSDSWFVLIPDWFWSFVLLSVRFHQSPFRALLMLLILSYMLQNSSIVVQNTPHTQEQSTVSSPTYLSPFLALVHSGSWFTSQGPQMSQGTFIRFSGSLWSFQWQLLQMSLECWHIRTSALLQLSSFCQVVQVQAWKQLFCQQKLS